MPVVARWGEYSLPAPTPVWDICAGYADDVRGQVLAGCGHFIAEERPEALLDVLLPSPI
jgi:haloacetate dehalogenase